MLECDLESCEKQSKQVRIRNLLYRPVVCWRSFLRSISIKSFKTVSGKYFDNFSKNINFTSFWSSCRKNIFRKFIHAHALGLLVTEFSNFSFYLRLFQPNSTVKNCFQMPQIAIFRPIKVFVEIKSKPVLCVV